VDEICLRLTAIICLFGNQASNLVLDLRSSKEDICRFPSRLGDLTAAPRSTSFHLDPILTGLEGQPQRIGRDSLPMNTDSAMINDPFRDYISQRCTFGVACDHVYIS